MSAKEILKQEAQEKHALLSKQEKAVLKRDMLKTVEQKEKESLSQARNAFVQILPNESARLPILDNIGSQNVLAQIEPLEDELVIDQEDVDEKQEIFPNEPMEIPIQVPSLKVNSANTTSNFRSKRIIGAALKSRKLAKQPTVAVATGDLRKLHNNQRGVRLANRNK